MKQTIIPSPLVGEGQVEGYYKVATLFNVIIACLLVFAPTLFADESSDTVSLDIVIEQELNFGPNETVGNVLRKIQNEVPGLELIIHPDVVAQSPDMIVAKKSLRYMLDAIVTARGYYYDLSGNMLTVSREKPLETEMVKYVIRNVNIKDPANRIRQIIPYIKILEHEQDRSLLIETTKRNHKKIEWILMQIDDRESLSVSQKIEEEVFVTEIIPVETNDKNVLYEIKAMIEPLKSEGGEVTIFIPTRKVIIRDTKKKIEEFKKFISIFSVLPVGDDDILAFTRKLKFAIPQEIKNAILFYVNNDPSKIVVNERRNGLTIYTTKKKFKEIDKIIEELDVLVDSAPSSIKHFIKEERGQYEKEPIQTKFYPAKWKSPADIARRIKKVLTKNGTVVSDMLTKNITVTDETSNFEKIDKAIERFDVSRGDALDLEEELNDTEVVKYHIRNKSKKKDMLRILKPLISDTDIENQEDDYLLIKTTSNNHKKLWWLIMEMSKEDISDSSAELSEELITEIITIDTDAFYTEKVVFDPFIRKFIMVDNVTELFCRIESEIYPLISEKGKIFTCIPTKKILIKDTIDNVVEFKKIIDILITGDEFKYDVFSMHLKYMTPTEIGEIILPFYNNKSEKVEVHDKENILRLFTTKNDFREMKYIIEQLDSLLGTQDKKEIQENMKLYRKYFRLYFKSSKSIAERMKPVITKNGYVIPSVIHKTIMVIDEEANFERIEKTVKEYDVP